MDTTGLIRASRQRRDLGRRTGRIRARRYLAAGGALEAPGAQVEDVEPLRTCTNLRGLNLLDVKVTDLRPLLDLERIELIEFDDPSALGYDEVRLKSGGWMR